jgi:hypothetical protein
VQQPTPYFPRRRINPSSPHAGITAADEATGHSGTRTAAPRHAVLNRSHRDNENPPSV